jgi:hypothetical protein
MELAMDDKLRASVLRVLDNLEIEIRALRAAISAGEATLIADHGHDTAVISATDVPIVLHMNRGELTALLPAVEYSPAAVAQDIPLTLRPDYQNGEMAFGDRCLVPGKTSISHRFRSEYER